MTQITAHAARLAAQVHHQIALPRIREENIAKECIHPHRQACAIYAKDTYGRCTSLGVVSVVGKQAKHWHVRDQIHSKDWQADMCNHE